MSENDRPTGEATRDGNVISDSVDPHNAPQPGRSLFRSWQLTVLASMYIGYAAFMLCRNTLIASSAAMLEDPSLNLDKESLGHLMSWHCAGAIMGKLVTGPGADLIGGRRMFLIALSITAIANVGFAFGSSFFVFAAFNFLGQFAKAGGWPAMTKLVGAWYPEARYGQVWSVISTSSRVGTIAAGLLLGFMLSLVSWRAVFVISAVLTGVVTVALWFYLKDEPEDVGLKPLESEDLSSADTATQVVPQHPLDQMTLLQACVAFLKSGRCWFICLSIVFLTIVMDFLIFIPVYLSETLGLDSSVGPMASTSFPAGMLVALMVTSVVYDRLTKGQLIAVLGGLLLTSCACLLILWRLDLIPSANHKPFAIGAIFLLGFSISPAYYVPMSIFAVSYGGKHSGFLVGVIDIFGYLGALVFTFFGGSIAEHLGWNVFLGGLLGVAMLATVCMVTFLALDRRAHAKRTQLEMA